MYLLYSYRFDVYVIFRFLQWSTAVTSSDLYTISCFIYHTLFLRRYLFIISCIQTCPSYIHEDEAKVPKDFIVKSSTIVAELSVVPTHYYNNT